jgi:hypothetical protein
MTLSEKEHLSCSSGGLRRKMGEEEYSDEEFDEEAM